MAKEAAVGALAYIVEKGDAQAIVAVAARLGAQPSGVRHAAVDALREIGEKGDQATTVAVAARLEDEERDVRCTVWRVCYR